jgi:hypothetical protein
VTVIADVVVCVPRSLRSLGGLLGHDRVDLGGDAPIHLEEEDEV